MNFEDLEKLVLTHIHVIMDIALQTDNEREWAKATKVYDISQKIYPLYQSWGENVPITFNLNFK
jgi:hypothetical protein